MDKPLAKAVMQRHMAPEKYKRHLDKSKPAINEAIARWLQTGNRESMRFLLRILGYNPCDVCDYIDDHCHCVK